MNSPPHCLARFQIVSGWFWVFLCQSLACYSAEPQLLNCGAHLFVDRQYIEKMENLEHVLHPPNREEVALLLDASWEGKQSGYGTVLQDPGGQYRFYYRGGGDVSTREVACLAVSHDGIHWEKPVLGIISLNGNKENNVVWTGAKPSYSTAHNFAPFVDSNPDCPPETRYKAVALEVGVDRQSGQRRKMLTVLGSPDGIHWKLLSEEPVIRQGSFDSLNTPFWDPFLQEYVCYLRHGKNGLRSIMRATSKDFLNWTSSEWLEFSPEQTEHYYTNAITLYPRASRLYLGFPMRFVPERTVIGKDSRVIDGTSDGVLISSRDGIHWDRTFRQAWLRPGLNPANWGDAHGNNTIANGILQTSPEELSIYWFENYGAVPRISRGSLRLDGFASLHAGAEEGICETPLFQIEGQRIALNYSTSAIGYVKVECLDKKGVPLSGYSIDESPTLYGDELKRWVKWENLENLPKGLAFRFRFTVMDADLYAFYISEESNE